MNPGPDLAWIFSDIVRVPHARHAVLLSSDGLVSAASEGVDRELAEHVAAIGAGMQSLSRSAARFASDSPTPWQQTMLRYGDAFVFLEAAGNGSFLVVSAGLDVDVEALSYQMRKSVDRLATELNVAPRHTPANGV